ncbi:hypothetical protein KIPB_001226 [Kipferlia bialata]|uniref:Uncharacterized protein n=1 Tax=Kipferlia bialata TaxID=797122 RepID=A0A9K3GF31_9EUKA|nr:hypothetical protein KIPB_001226 [Kipferlia bialata]|eukprot:g1226.t1
MCCHPAEASVGWLGLPIISAFNPSVPPAAVRVSPDAYRRHSTLEEDSEGERGRERETETEGEAETEGERDSADQSDSTGSYQTPTPLSLPLPLTLAPRVVESEAGHSPVTERERESEGEDSDEEAITEPEALVDDDDMYTVGERERHSTPEGDDNPGSHITDTIHTGTQPSESEADLSSPESESEDPPFTPSRSISPPDTDSD